LQFRLGAPPPKKKKKKKKEKKTLVRDFYTLEALAVTQLRNENVIEWSVYRLH